MNFPQYPNKSSEETDKGEETEKYHSSEETYKYGETENISQQIWKFF